MAIERSRTVDSASSSVAPPRLDKRLLHIIQSFSPTGGGPVAGIEELAAAAARARGAGLEVVCLDDPAAEHLRSRQLPVHALGPVKSYYGSTPRLAEWLRANLRRFDGAVIHGLWLYCGYGSYRVLRGRLPYAIFPHGMLDPYFRRAFPLKHLRKQAYWLARERRILRDARAVCFTTAIERDLAAHTMWPYQAKPLVVSFGASAPSGDPEKQRRRFFDAFPQLKDRKFFLLLSRIHPKKGFDMAISAFASIAAKRPDLDLVIAGPDEAGLRDALTAQAEVLGVGARLHWTGMLCGDEKWGALRSAEAFVLPSHQENFCVAAVEALALKLPVILSNKVNIWPDLVEDGAAIVDDDTLEGTLRSMTRFLSMSPEQRRRMVENGVSAFERRYDMLRTAQALNDLFS